MFNIIGEKSQKTGVTAIIYLLIYFLLSLAAAPQLFALPVIDHSGQKIELSTVPSQVVSLVPSATEIICAIGAGDSLNGVTYHDTNMSCLAGKNIVGGAFTPQYGLIKALKPDLVIVPPQLLENTKKQLSEQPCGIFVFDDGASLEKSKENIKLVGQIFQKESQALKVIEDNELLLSTIAKKVEKISPEKRQRVMRLMLTESGLMTTGKDSFQSEMIKAAGALPPQFENGIFVPVSLKQWRDFNPEFVYACGDCREELVNFLNQPGWNEVAAIKNSQIHYFPCALTCRAASNTGYFVAWLASTIYSDDFSDKNKLVHEQKILSELQLELPLDYVEKARVVESRIMDFAHRTLLIDFKNEQNIISTAAGAKSHIKTVGNNYSPTSTWSIYHKLGFDESRRILLDALKLDDARVEILSTGADMNNLVVKTVSYKDMSVTVLATAGVEGNALRTSKDVGRWYEKPGTINIIVLTNHKLSPRATARAIITITEAKTAALWDMDIRSVQTALNNPATGTGTDDIIVVSGEGQEITGTGGHSKMGQLIGEAVYAAVQEALLKQNGKTQARNVFERLEERGLSPYKLVNAMDCDVCRARASDLQMEMEALLLSSSGSAFLESAFSLSDAQLMGQFADSSFFEQWCKNYASEIAGHPVTELEYISKGENVPPVLAMALSSIYTGLKQRHSKK